MLLLLRRIIKSFFSILWGIILYQKWVQSADNHFLVQKLTFKKYSKNFRIHDKSFLENVSLLIFCVLCQGGTYSISSLAKQHPS